MGWCGVGDGRELYLSGKRWWYSRWRPYFLWSNWIRWRRTDGCGLGVIPRFQWAWPTITSEVFDSPKLVNFLFWSFWKCDVPSKVLAFSWRLILDMLPTRVALVRKGVLVEDGGCVFCRADRKDSQHLFLGCTFLFLDLVWGLPLVGYFFSATFGGSALFHA